MTTSELQDLFDLAHALEREAKDAWEAGEETLAARLTFEFSQAKHRFLEAVWSQYVGALAS